MVTSRYRPTATADKNAESAYLRLLELFPSERAALTERYKSNPHSFYNVEDEAKVSLYNERQSLKQKLRRRRKKLDQITDKSTDKAISIASEIDQLEEQLGEFTGESNSSRYISDYIHRNRTNNMSEDEKKADDGQSEPFDYNKDNGIPPPVETPQQDSFSIRGAMDPQSTPGPIRRALNHPPTPASGATNLPPTTPMRMQSYMRRTLESNDPAERAVGWGFMMQFAQSQANDSQASLHFARAMEMNSLTFNAIIAEDVEGDGSKGALSEGALPAIAAAPIGAPAAIAGAAATIAPSTIAGAAATIVPPAITGNAAATIAPPITSASTAIDGASCEAGTAPIDAPPTNTAAPIWHVPEAWKAAVPPITSAPTAIGEGETIGNDAPVNGEEGKCLKYIPTVLLHSFI